MGRGLFTRKSKGYRGGDVPYTCWPNAGLSPYRRLGQGQPTTFPAPEPSRLPSKPAMKASKAIMISAKRRRLWLVG